MSVTLNILNKIKEYNRIMIHGHIRPDGDCYGSQFGLKDIIKTSFPEKEVYVVGEICNYVSFLGTPDNISDDMYQGALAICVDCASGERLSDQRYKMADFVIKIDHHIVVDSYGDINLVKDEKPACTEIIFDLYNEFKDELKIAEQGAKALYTGLVTDTGRFRFDSVSSNTFKVAASLLDLGVKVDEIDNLLSVETLEVMKFKGYVLSHFKLTKEGFAYVVVKKEVVEKYNISYEDAANQVNVISTLPDYPVWALIIEYPNEIRVRLRSRGPAIDALANQYGGGGHAKASGCHLDSFDDLKQFVKDTNQVVKKYKILN